jgi:hypothetical protein
MTATSRAPYFDFLGVNVDAALADTADGVLEVVLEPELVVAVADVAVVFPAEPEPVAVDRVVAAVEFALVVPLADEVTVALLLDEDPPEVWAKTPPDEEDWMLEVTDDATLEPAEEETAVPLQVPEIFMLCQLPDSSPYVYSLPQL